MIRIDSISKRHGDQILSDDVLELGPEGPRVYAGGYAEYVVASGHEAPGMRTDASAKRAQRAPARNSLAGGERRPEPERERSESARSG